MRREEHNVRSRCTATAAGSTATGTPSWRRSGVRAADVVRVPLGTFTSRRRRPAVRRAPGRQQLPGPATRVGAARHRDGSRRRRDRGLVPAPPTDLREALGLLGGRRRTWPGRQLPPALRPLRRQPAARQHAVICQRRELATARAGDYTFDHLVEAAPTSSSTARPSAARAARGPDARPRRRPPVAGRGVRDAQSCWPGSPMTPAAAWARPRRDQRPAPPTRRRPGG